MLYYLSQSILEWAEGTAWAELRLAAAAVPLHHVPQRGRGDHGAGVELVARAESHPLAEAAQVRPGIRGQGGGSRRSDTRILSKKGTPTMGGILIVVVLDLTTLLWAQWNTLIQLTLLSVLVLAGLGFYDDYAKIIKQSGGGATPQVKLWVQFALAVFVAVYLWKLPATSELHLPESHDGHGTAISSA